MNISKKLKEHVATVLIAGISTFCTDFCGFCRVRAVSQEADAKMLNVSRFFIKYESMTKESKQSVKKL